jgi:hypothetical protein
MLDISDGERALAVQLFDSTAKLKLPTVGSIETKDVVPSSFLREATELCHFPKSKMVAPSCARTASTPSTGKRSERPACRPRLHPPDHQFATMIAFVEPVFLVLSSVPAFVNEAAAPAQGATISRRKAAFIGQISAFRIAPL